MIRLLLALSLTALLLGCPRNDPSGPTTQPTCILGFGEGCSSTSVW